LGFAFILTIAVKTEFKIVFTYLDHYSELIFFASARMVMKIGPYVHDPKFDSVSSVCLKDDFIFDELFIGTAAPIIVLIFLVSTRLEVNSPSSANLILTCDIELTDVFSRLTLKVPDKNSVSDRGLNCDAG